MVGWGQEPRECALYLVINQQPNQRKSPTRGTDISDRQMLNLEISEDHHRRRDSRVAVVGGFISSAYC